MFNFYDNNVSKISYFANRKTKFNEMNVRDQEYTYTNQ